MNRQSNKITAVYCRLAHYKGDTDRDIAKVQVEQLTRYAAELGLENPELFCDWGFSGLDDKRPQYQRMLRAVGAGEVSSLVVWDHSRLGRDYQTCGELVEIILPRHSVTLHSVKEGIIYTPQALSELAARREAICTLFRQTRLERGRR